MRKALAFCCLGGIVLSIAALDYVILTSSAALSLIAERELRSVAGSNVEFDALRATFDGTIVLENLGLKVTRKSIPVLSADRAEVKLGRRGPMYVPETITLVSPRLSLSKDFFKQIAVEPVQRPLRELYPPDALPRIICQGGHLEIIHDEFLHWSAPQIFAIENLALVPVTGYRYFVGGRLTSALFGSWTLSGEIDLDSGAANLTLAGDEFHVGPHVRAILTPTLHETWDTYRPEGRARARIRVQADPGAPARISATVNPIDVKMVYAEFPYPVEDVAGELEFYANSFIIKHLTARSGDTRIRFDGRAGGYGAESDFAFRVEIDSMPLDEKLRAALPPEARRVYDQFRPTGVADVKGLVLREYGWDKPVRNPLDCRLRNATFLYLPFPYPLEQVEGEIHLDVPNVRVNHLTGRHGSGRFAITGTIEDIDADPVVDLYIRGEEVTLDAPLKHALEEENRKTWERFSPSGLVDVLWHVTKKKGDKDFTHASKATARGCRVTFREIPLPVSNVTGDITYLADEIHFNHMSGKLDPGSGSLNGKVVLTPKGSIHTYDISVVGAQVDERFRRAMPQQVAELLDTLKLTGLVNFDAHFDLKFEGAQEEMFWRIRIDLRRAAIEAAVRIDDIEGVVDCYGSIDAQGRRRGSGTLSWQSARIMKKRITDASASFDIIGNEVIFKKMHATAYGGTLTGYLRIDSKTTDMTGEFSVDRLDIREFVRDTDSYANRVLSGRVNLQISDLAGRGNDISTLTARGTTIITDGQLFEVPAISKILSPFSATKRFDAGKIVFEIRNSKFDIQSFGFESDAGSVFGKGYLTFDLDYNVRVGVKLAPILGIKFFLFEIPGAIMSQFMRTRLKGNLNSADVETEEILEEK